MFDRPNRPLIYPFLLLYLSSYQFVCLSYGRYSPDILWRVTLARARARVLWELSFFHVIRNISIRSLLFLFHALFLYDTKRKRRIPPSLLFTPHIPQQLKEKEKYQPDQSDIHIFLFISFSILQVLCWFVRFHLKIVIFISLPVNGLLILRRYVATCKHSACS